jgi:predicted nucleotidyltransferase
MGHMAAKFAPKSAREAYFKYLPPDVPLAAIRQFARRIVERFHPEKIILFGSFAYGKPHAESDVDLLIVMPARAELTKAAQIELAFEPVFPLDLLVRTPERLRRRLANGDQFLQEIVSKGIVLYENRNPRLGTQGRAGLGGRRSRGSRKETPQRCRRV